VGIGGLRSLKSPPASRVCLSDSKLNPALNQTIFLPLVSGSFPSSEINFVVSYSPAVLPTVFCNRLVHFAALVKFSLARFSQTKYKSSPINFHL